MEAAEKSARAELAGLKAIYGRKELARLLGIKRRTLDANLAGRYRVPAARYVLARLLAGDPGLADRIRKLLWDDEKSRQLRGRWLIGELSGRYSTGKLAELLACSESALYNYRRSYLPGERFILGWLIHAEPAVYIPKISGLLYCLKQKQEKQK